MEMRSVKSSNLESVGYDPVTEILAVKFQRNPKVYEYAGVPQQKHLEMMSADSIGSYFARNIRGKFGPPEGQGA
ncbi:MAG TPA: KTSC domain-containing protein [Phycisphaerae bacterium]|nr:KTSC domain-containing protein [Phycisphaerae bacterium]